MAIYTDIPTNMKITNAIDSEYISAVLLFLIYIIILLITLWDARFFNTIDRLAEPIQNNIANTTNFSMRYYILNANMTNPNSIPQRMKKNIANSNPMLNDSNANGRK